MILKVLVSGLVVFGAFFAGQKVATPQDADPKAPSKEDMAKMMAAYEAAGKPGEPHKGLASLVGTWDQKVVCMMPGMPQTENTGTAVYKSILGGRFVVEEMNGKMSMPTADGKLETKDFSGFQVMGYDNTLKEYQALWCDSMGTGMFLSTGKADASGKSITYEGIMKDVMTPQGRPWKMVVNLEGPDKHVLDMYDAFDGKNLVKVMTVTETRK
jgi:Protein of unknown function (DUF1579)